MDDQIGKLILRKLRQIFIWPLEATIVFIMYFAAACCQCQRRAGLSVRLCASLDH